MWLTLYLGGQLKPYIVNRHSEAKEFIIYKSLLRQDEIEAEKIGIDIAVNNLKYPKTVVEFNFSSEAKPPDSITGFKDWYSAPKPAIIFLLLNWSWPWSVGTEELNVGALGAVPVTEEAVNSLSL